MCFFTVNLLLLKFKERLHASSLFRYINVTSSIQLL